jgi:phage N-6-adenine-methyltransferase
MAKMPAQRPGLSRQDYATPPEFIVAVKRLLKISSFTIDLAADATNAKAFRFYTEDQNALVQDWRQFAGPGWAWLNPPFGHIDPWAEKCAASRPTNIAFLVPASVGADWFRDHVDKKALVLALNGRLSFDGIAPYPKDTILALYGMSPGFAVWNWRATLAREGTT